MKIVDPQLTSVIVPEDELEIIGNCLEKAQDELRATGILVLDQAGQVLAYRSMRNVFDPSTVGALLTGTFYGSRELARALHEPEFTTLFQQGPRESIYAEMIGNKWVLAIIFRNQTLLGMVRVVSKRAVGELDIVLKRVLENNQVRGRWFGQQMIDSFDSTLQELFRD